MHQHQHSSLIAKTALDHYFETLPGNKGKPQPGQWTVYAAIVATKTHHTASLPSRKEAWVVSCATGSKCATIQPALNHFGTENIPKCVDATELHKVNSITKWSCGELCCSSQVKGFVVHDSHAEVIARRGLVKVMWEEILSTLKSCDEPSDEITAKHEKSLLQLVGRNTNSSEGTDHNNKCQFELRNDVQLHLYISDSPCGDASIYDIAQKYANNQNKDSNQGITYTGAKIVVSDDSKTQSDDNLFECSGSSAVKELQTKQNNSESNHKETSSLQINIARERVQIKSALRLKSGRSDIPSHLRSSSMSCSDKICKWIILGLQGCGALARFIPKGVYLSSIVVSNDPRAEQKTDGDDNSSDTQLDALNRALIRRARETFEILESVAKQHDVDTTLQLNLPTIRIIDQSFPSGKAVMDKSIIDKKLTLSNNDAHQFSDPEITIDEKNCKKRSLCHESNSITRKRQKGTKISPCGISLNWQSSFLCKEISKSSNDIEQLVGAKGILQRKKPKCVNDVIKCVSRLSRYSLNNLSIEALNLIGINENVNSDTSKKHSYQQIKEAFAPIRLRNLMKLLQQCNNPLQGWVKNSSEYDFSICSQR